MELNQIASAILNDLWGGNLIPLSNRSLISIEQIEDEIIAERALIAKEWYLKSALNKEDMALSINCIPIDCKDPSRCPCSEGISANHIQHFEIPQLMEGLGKDAIIYVGSTDRAVSYKVYFNKEAIKYQKYKRRDNNRPYVYIERTPNENGMYDGWIFNAPFVKKITVIGVFKDPRQLEGYDCCGDTNYLDMGVLSSEIIRRILAKKVNLYRTIPPAATNITS